LALRFFRSACWEGRFRKAAHGIDARRLARQAEREALSYERYLHELVQRECEERQENRTAKMLRESQLPLEKSLEAFDARRLPAKAARQMRSLLDGGFLERTENALVFGNPGSGKTHLLQAVGQELIRKGRRIFFTTCEMLVQELLIAKRDLKLSKLIKNYARYEGMIIDDLGYIRQTREEMEVVFTLLAERYERGSVLLTSNLPFSEWEGIFKDPMTTAAAMDRLVHHSIIIELNIPSYRLEHAKTNIQSLGAEGKDAAAPDSGELPSGSGLRPPPPASSPESQVNVAEP
jgi:DNA replication protein DnaC